MPTLWRISNYASLSGEGGLLYSARWHTAGHRIVYLAESPAGAVVEALVHLELDETDWPRRYQLMQVDYPDSMSPETLKPTPARTWKTSLATTRKLGDAWLRGRGSALVRVPSVILPETWNVLLNPEHEDARLVRITRTMRAEYDPRLLVAIAKVGQLKTGQLRTGQLRSGQLMKRAAKKRAAGAGVECPDCR